MQKILGIGLSKTGTNSLTKALIILGYNAVHYVLHPELWLKKCDAATDITVSYKYKELDKIFPKSKFILTIRDINSWLESCYYHFNWVDSLQLPKNVLNRIYTIRRKMYGIDKFDPRIFKEVYIKHYKDVTDYFKFRQEDLLILNICAGEGWEKLCPFLNKELPVVPFPHENRRKKVGE
jgi:hypothetical protein